MNALTLDTDFLDKLLFGLSEEEMVERIPSNVYIARAVPAGNKFHALFSAPGLTPMIAQRPDGTPYEYNTAVEAEAGAVRSLFGVLNGPRIKARQSQGKPERYTKLTGPEFAVLLAKAGLTPTFFAFLYGTSQVRVLSWIDGAEDVPHPVRILLETFVAFPGAIDVAEKVTEANTALKRPARTAAAD